MSTSSRYLLGLTVVCLACGDDAASQPTRDGSVTASPDGGADGDAAAADASIKHGDGGAFCLPTENLPGTCTPADYSFYQQCVQTTCDTDYQKCYGPDYKNGNFAGPCASFLRCTAACGCNNTTCVLRCSVSDSCKTCTAGLACDTSSCKEPSCANQTTPRDAGTGSGGYACSDLMTCCNGISQIKDVCLMQISNAQQNAAMSNGAFTADAICESVHAGYRTQGFCQ